MADVKWIKITTDIFDDEKIKIIDTMPARDEILVIWFKLLALTGKTNQNGMLFMNNRIPYTQEMLAAVFNRELNVVKLSLDIFRKFGMIEIEENEVICISNWEKHQNIDGLEKIRMQTNERVKKVREKKKQLLLSDCNATCNVTVTHGNATDIELELEKENKENKKSNRFTPPTIEEVSKYCLERNNGINPQKFIDYNQSKGWVVGKTTMKDWKAAIRTWESKEIKSNQSRKAADF